MSDDSTEFERAVAAVRSLMATLTTYGEQVRRAETDMISAIRQTRSAHRETRLAGMSDADEITVDLEFPRRRWSRGG